MTDRQELKRLAEAAYGAKFQTEGFEQTDGRGQHYGGLILHENGHTIIASCVMQPWADFIAAANPAAILALIAENEGLHAQHARDSGELRKLCAARDSARRGRDHLKAENAGLQTGFKAYEATVQELKAEVESLRPNAARYMWLRQQNIQLEGHDFLSFGEVLDNRIDDALAMERHP